MCQENIIIPEPGEFILTIPHNEATRSAISEMRQHLTEIGIRYHGSLADTLGERRSAQSLRELPQSFHLIEVRDADLTGLIGQLLGEWYRSRVGDGATLEIEPNIAFVPTTTASWQGISNATNFQLGGQHHTYLSQINADKAAKQSITGQGVRIAVLDTGIFLNKLPNIAAFVDVTMDPPGATRADATGHGTAVAMLVDAVAPGAELYVVRTGTTYHALWNVLRGIATASFDYDVHIVNLSLGIERFGRCRSCGGTAGSQSTALEHMIEWMTWTNAPRTRPIYMVSTGNRRPAGSRFFYPAHYPRTLAVGAVTSRDVRSSFSNYGSRQNDYVLAPGGEDPSTGTIESVGDFLDDATPPTRTPFFGTSAATAYASGVAALLKCSNPILNRDTLTGAIISNCRALGSNPTEYGAGGIEFR